MSGQAQEGQDVLAGARLSAIVAASHDAICTVSPEGTITGWNRGAEQLYGYSAAEIVGQPLSRLVPPGLEPEVPALLARLACGEPVDHFRTVRRRMEGTETILQVEDDDLVRGLTRTMLERFGYQVLEAASGEEALRRAAEHGGPIHLLFTDVVMPGMSGHDLAQRLRPLRPEMRVLYTSGYADDAVVRHGIFTAEVAFIQKPFAAQELGRLVRELLDGG